tara:strand:- start:362 stop:1438 length:1077 start_codon:yes stop_codon:yes gene_type:complete
MNHRFLFTFLFSLSILISQSFYGNKFPIDRIKYEPQKYICYKADSPIVLDGKIDDKAWENIEWTQSFVDIEGDLKPRPYYDTKVKMTWDEDYFYFGAKMEDPHVWATLTERDAVIFKDNDFEIFLDPDGDTHNYYELEVNAFETEWDLMLLKPYHDDSHVALDSWDIPGLITKVYINGTINNPSDKDKGWSVEIAIPWKAFAGNFRSNNYPKEGEEWKVNFSRVHWETDIISSKYVKKDKPEFNWVWSPQGLISMHMPERWGLVRFTENRKKEKIKFIDSDIDNVRWAMRQIYYCQGNYFLENKKYSTSVDELGLAKSPVKNIDWDPQIFITPSGWEASISYKKNKIIIRKDGKVWTE